MQHLRDIGSGASDGQSYFVEAPVPKQPKGTIRMRLEDVLKEATLEDAYAQGPDTINVPPSLSEATRNLRSPEKGSYQRQQDVPEARRR